MKKGEGKRSMETLRASGAAESVEAFADDGAAQLRPTQADKRRQVMLHVGTSASTFAVNITGIYGADMSGFIYHMYTETRVPFRTMFEAAVSIQKITDALDYPQRGYRIRSWHDVPNPFAGFGDEDRLPRRIGVGQATNAAPSRSLPLRRDAPIAAQQGVPEQAGEGRPLATVLIRIQYRQNASWQGVAIWSGAGTPVKFRSVLELMMLIAEARDDCLKDALPEEVRGEPDGADA